jgi:hypothetical protein
MSGTEPRAWELLSLLHEASRRDEIIASPETFIRVLRELEGLSDVRMIPYLVGLLADVRRRPRLVDRWRRWRARNEQPSETFDQALRESIERTLDRTSARDLATLITSMRWDGYAEALGPWGEMASAEDLNELARGDRALLRLASFHRNGFVREEAVLRIADAHDASALPFLLLRLNDWVQQVRRRAEVAVLDRMLPEHAGSLVECLLFFQRLEDQGRADRELILGGLRGVLCSDSGRKALLDGARTGERELRRECFRWLLDAPSASDAETFALGKVDPDLSIRMMCVRALASRLEDSQTPSRLDAFADDGHATVRCECLRARVDLDPVSARPHLIRALWDPSAPVRESVLYYLREDLSPSAAAAMYRERLSGHGTALTLIAIGGLEACGQPQDAERVRSFVGHPSARVARSALRSLWRLAPDAARTTVRACLADSRPGVVRQAAELLGDFGGAEDEAALATAISSNTPGVAKRPLARLTRRLELWQRLETLLSFPFECMAEGLASIERELNSWCEEHEHGTRAPRRPTDEELRRIMGRLAHASEWLSSEVCARVRGRMRGTPS